jgi:hypothetical protein
MRLKEEHEYLKLILSIGGGATSQNFATVAASAATRDNFGRSAKGLVEASGFDGIDSESAEICLQLLLTLDKLTGSILPTPSKGETSSHCSLLYDFTSQTSVTSYQRLCRLGNGHCRTLIFTKLKTTSTCSISWPTTLQVHGHRQQDTMPSCSLEILVKLQVQQRLNMCYPPASRPRKYYLVSLFMDARSWVQLAQDRRFMGMVVKKEPSNTNNFRGQALKRLSIPEWFPLSA